MVSDPKTPQPDEKKKSEEAFSSILSVPAPQFYFNGFNTGNTTGDVIAILQLNGQPIVRLNMSYTVAKSFSVSLGQAIAQIEQLSGRDMLTVTEIDALMKKSGQPMVKMGDQK